MKINDDVIKVIIEQAKKDAPIESCGLLLGKDDVVTESYWMETSTIARSIFPLLRKTSLRL